MLSWDGRYDEARSELERVLGQTPDYLDARAALMNVEWWSGDDEAARAHAREILSKQARHPQASLVEQRLGARSRPWKATSSYAYDWFDDDRDAWHEWAFSAGRETPYGSLLLRGSRAERFDLDDGFLEVEAYPRFREGTYAYVAVGAATRSDLYPKLRVGVDLYQSLPFGLEVSGGYRRLEFSNPADVVVASLSKYWGNWMLTARVYHVPGSGDLDSTSYFGSLRRYFGPSGTSYVGLRYGHGISREEVRSIADAVTLDSDSLTGELDYALSPRWSLGLSAGVSRQDRATASDLWQVSIATSLGLRF